MKIDVYQRNSNFFIGNVFDVVMQAYSQEASLFVWFLPGAAPRVTCPDNLVVSTNFMGYPRGMLAFHAPAKGVLPEHGLLVQQLCSGRVADRSVTVDNITNLLMHLGAPPEVAKYVEYIFGEGS